MPDAEPATPFLTDSPGLFVADVAPGIGAVFTTDGARAAGVSKRRLQRGTTTLSGGLHQSREGPLPSREAVLRATMALMPAHAALYGRTAALWWGLPVTDNAVTHVVVPEGATKPRRRRGLQPHAGDGDVVIHRGLRVTVPSRVFLDLAAELRRELLIIAGDAMVSEGLAARAELVHLVNETRRRRGILLARELAPLLSDRVDSPMESVLRLTLIDGGLPEPAVNPDLYDEGGGWIGRPDLAYLLLFLAIQYEGDVHRTSKKRWRSDIARDEALLDDGWDVVRVTALDLQHPGRLVHRIRRRARRQAARLGVDLDPAFTA